MLVKLTEGNILHFSNQRHVQHQTCIYEKMTLLRRFRHAISFLSQKCTNNFDRDSHLQASLHTSVGHYNEIHELAYIYLIHCRTLHYLYLTGQESMAINCNRRFHRKKRIPFCTVRVTDHWDKLPREDLESLSLEIFKGIWSWCWATWSKCTCSRRKLDLMNSRGPFQPQLFNNSVVFGA